MGAGVVAGAARRFAGAVLPPLAWLLLALRSVDPTPIVARSKARGAR